MENKKPKRVHSELDDHEKMLSIEELPEKPGIGRRSFFEALTAGGLAAVAILLGDRLGFEQAKGVFAQVTSGTAGSYIVFTDYGDGNKIKALNGMTGQLDYSGTDAAAVIQNAINALSTTGGIVILKEGTYNIATSLTWKNDSNIMIQGSGSDTTILNYTGPGGTSILDFDPGSYVGSKNRVILSDFQVRSDSVPANTIAVNLNNVVRASVKRIMLRAPNGSIQPAYGFYTHGQGNNSLILEDCVSSDYDTGYEIFQDHVLLLRCAASFGRVGFNFRTAGAEIAGVDLIAYHQRADNGIGFRIDYSSYAGQIVLISPYSENPAGTCAPTDFSVNAGVGSVVLLNPQAIRTPPVVSLAGNYYYAVGKYFSGQGKAAFSGDKVTTKFAFPHGLATTPRIVSLSAESADAAGDLYWSADSKNVTVIFKAAPPVGKNNVRLAWKAEV